MSKKRKLTSQEIKNKKAQRFRILILSDLYLSIKFVELIHDKLSYESTHISPVMSCSSWAMLDYMKNTLFTVRANTYNLLGSVSAWNKGWKGTQNLVAEKFGKPDTYKVGEHSLPAKIFEWTVQDTFKNIIAQQAAAKKEIIRDIYKLPGLTLRVAKKGEKLSKEDKAYNRDVEKTRKELVRIIDKEDFNTISKYPLLHRLLRKHYRRGHCKQCRQIVFMPQAYKCTNINNKLKLLDIQSPFPGERIQIVVKTKIEITGQIRLIQNQSGNWEVHTLNQVFIKLPEGFDQRKERIAVDRGYSEVFWTTTNQELGKGFGKLLTKKSSRITRKGRNRNRLFALVDSLRKTDPKKAKKILNCNLRRKTEDKRNDRDVLEVSNIVNYACKKACLLTKEIVVEHLVENIVSSVKISRRARNKLNQWMKGLVAQRLEFWAGKLGVRLTYVNAAYTSQVDSRNGTLLGIRSGNIFVGHDGVKQQADLNAAKNIEKRHNDSEIGLYLNYREVQGVLLERTHNFLASIGKTLLEAVDNGWLDPKHKKHLKFKALSQN